MDEASDPAQNAPPQLRKRVYLHIGTHKTGTTSIQWALTFSRAMLAARGLCYPQAGCPEWSAFGHHMLAWSALERPAYYPGRRQDEVLPSTAERAALWEALRAEIEESGAHTIVLSSEEFDILSREEIDIVAAELRDYEIVPVVFLRNFADMLESGFRTAVLHSAYNNDIEHFVAHQRIRQDYAAQLRDWRSIATGGQLIAFAYDDPIIGGDAVGIFLSVLGLSKNDLSPRGRESQNESLPAFVCELVRRMRLDGVEEPALRDWMTHVRGFRFRAEANRAYTLMPPALRDRLDRAYAAECERIEAAGHGAGVQGVLHPVRADDTPPHLIQDYSSAVLAFAKETVKAPDAPKRTATMMTTANLTEEEWHNLWLRQATHGDVAGLPPMAPVERQQTLHGTSGVSAMQGALKFRRVVMGQIGALPGDARFLDFGCGWGRHMRVYLKDVPLSNMTGVDIDPANIEMCREALSDANFVLCREGEALPVASDSQDLIMSFSVFSHLSADSARFWLGELARLVKPGGHVVVTSWGKAIFDIFARIRETGETQFAWEKNIAHAFGDTDDVERRYRAGEHVFGKHKIVGALDPELYGISLMPKQWVEANTSLRVRNWIEDTSVVPQTTFILTK